MRTKLTHWASTTMNAPFGLRLTNKYKKQISSNIVGQTILQVPATEITSLENGTASGKGI